MNDSNLYRILFSVFVCSTAVHAQENKYTKRNKTAPIIQYTTDKCYSRSILVQDTLVYTANSNGSMYVTGLKSKQSRNILANGKYEELRDLFSANGMISAVQSGSKGVISQTDGSRFLSDYEMNDDAWKSVFIDGVDIRDSVGFMMGDPKNGVFQIFKSLDSGNTWTRCPGSVGAYEGEAGFAASGTNVQVLNDSTYVFVSGGKKSRCFRTNDGGSTWEYTSLPYMTSESSGAFSICMINQLEGVIVGGDYKNPDLCMNTCFFTDDGGKFWINAKTQTRGYRSCVIYKNGVFYACGSNGIDYSTDKGENWKPFADGTFMAMCADNLKIYATMPNGSFQIFELIDRK